MSNAITELVKGDDTPIEDLANQSILISKAAAPNGSVQLTAPATDWYTIILLAERQGRARTRTMLANLLVKHYPGMVNPAESNQVLSILVSGENYTKIKDVADADTNIQFPDAEYDGDIAANPARVNVKREPKASTPKECECGCGDMTRGGKFIPGHDSKMKSRLLGELLNPETRSEASATLLDRGWASQEQIDKKIDERDRKIAAAAEREQEKARKAAEKEAQRAERERLKQEAEAEAANAA